jgi:hypothetical protein
VIDDVVVVDGRIDRGEFFQRLDRGFDKEGHEAEFDPVFLFELILVAVAQFHHRLHVDLVEGRQDRGVGLGLQQAFGEVRAFEQDPRFVHRRTESLVGGGIEIDAG